MDDGNGSSDSDRNMRSPVIRLVPFHHIAEYVAKNLHIHYGEMKVKDPLGPFNLDWDYYLSESHEGRCVAVEVFDGRTVGYSVYFIQNNANHKHVIEANNAGVFLEKKYRGKTSFKLFKEAEKLLKPLGVHKISYLFPDEKMGKILPGYKPEHILWSRNI